VAFLARFIDLVGDAQRAAFRDRQQMIFSGRKYIFRSINPHFEKLCRFDRNNLAFDFLSRAFVESGELHTLCEPSVAFISGDRIRTKPMDVG